MIIKSGKGYKVKSEGGKNLSKGGLSKEAAVKRLKQVEYYKAHPEKSKSRGK
jgi:hypothetical protein